MYHAIRDDERERPISVCPVRSAASAY